MSNFENENYEQEQKYSDYQTFNRGCEVKNLTEKIKKQPNNLRLQQKRAFLQKAQVNYLVGSEKFKLLLDLSNCYNQIIELFPQNDEQNLNVDDYEQDWDGLYDQFKVSPIAQIIEDRTKIIDQHKKMVEDANEMIIQLDQQILLEPLNDKLYLEQLQHQQIIILNKIGEDQFLQELQKAFQMLQTALINDPNYQKSLFDKQVEFCKQILKNLDYDSLEYLIIVMQIMKTYDEFIKFNPQITKHLKEQKVMDLKIILGYGPDFIILGDREIYYLKEICQNCISSIKTEDIQNKIEEINNLSVQAKVYFIFAKIYTKNIKFPIQNNLEFQLASQLLKQILCILDKSQREFENELEYLRFKSKTYKNLIEMIYDNEEKIEFQKQVCQIQEQICQFSREFYDTDHQIDEFEQLIKYKEKDDVEILNKIIKVYDKMIQNYKKNQQSYGWRNEQGFYQKFYIKKAQIFDRIAKQQDNLTGKEQQICNALDQLKQAQQLDQSYCPFIIQRLQILIKVPVVLGIQNTWNKYYDQVLEALKESSDLFVFDKFIRDLFNTILRRFPENDQQEITRKFYQLLNSILSRRQQKELTFLIKGQILEKMGDLMKNEEQQFYYNESLSSLNQAINIEQPNSQAVIDKLNLLIKLNRNLEALDLTKKLIKYQKFSKFNKKAMIFLLRNLILDKPYQYVDQQNKRDVILMFELQKIKYEIYDKNNYSNINKLNLPIFLSLLQDYFSKRGDPIFQRFEIKNLIINCLEKYAYIIYTKKINIYFIIKKLFCQQVNYLECSKKFKLLIGLQNYQNQIIELSYIDEQIQIFKNYKKIIQQMILKINKRNQIYILEFSIKLEPEMQPK